MRLLIATPLDLDQVLRRPIEFAQYVSLAFGERCREAGIDLSMTEGGSPHDNAMAESFVDSLKTELVRDRVWRSRSQLELAVVEWVSWFNSVRIHSEIGDVPPVEFEDLYARQRALDLSPSMKQGIT